MKNRKLSFYLISIAITALLLAFLQDYVTGLAKLNRLMLTEDTLDKVRAQKVSPELIAKFGEWEKEGGASCYEYLYGYLVSGETTEGALSWYISRMRQHWPGDFKVLTGYLAAVWEDLVYFPVPASGVHEDAGVSFGDSWMSERTFGGKRGHEGTDLMASINERGRYPVISMTDGVVEQVGWLTKGGYRLGIRSPHGGYFYYAHLYDYAREFQPGDTVKAGEWIGFMGDSGYSEIEGTVGNFDVHLHVGIYVNQPDGTEMSINPYGPLKYLEGRKLTYTYY